MKSARSMKSRLIIPFCLILVVQTVFMMVFLSNGMVAKSLYMNEISSLEKDVQNNELLLEREMVQHWLSDIRSSDTIQKRIQALLKERGINPDGLEAEFPDLKWNHAGCSESAPQKLRKQRVCDLKWSGIQPEQKRPQSRCCCHGYR